MKISRALISVSDKSGLEDFAKRLHALGVEILSTGGTARFLAEHGIPVVDVSDYTGEPELFDGRLKDPPSKSAWRDAVPPRPPDRSWPRPRNTVSKRSTS